jgi:hypothetical protein
MKRQVKDIQRFHDILIDSPNHGVLLDQPVDIDTRGDKSWVMTNDPRIVTAARMIEEHEKSNWPDCYHCGLKFDPDEFVADVEFHQDGKYCSRECLVQEMRDIESWAAEMED